MNPDDHVKEVYAIFGLAVYLAQVLEHAVVNALMHIDLISKRPKSCSPEEWEKTFDKYLETQFDLTMGRMIQRLKEVSTLPDDLERLLKLALQKRNWLAHDYFRERATDFMSESGREVMIEELEQAGNLFRYVDHRLEETIKPVRERYGLTDEKIAEHFENWKKQFAVDL
jgi:hypothetical protein